MVVSEFPHPFDETGPFSVGVDLMLQHEDGSESLARGVLGREPVTDENLQAPSELSAWAKTPANESRVTGVLVPAAVAGTEQRFRVLEIEPHAGALYSRHGRATTQYRVRES